ncbi:hypothetical protein [Segatella buccae]|uniref:hypothetical protein n=1 Tax=Segatella buccae TaxID=28126 RepID=UPI00128C74B0|nr:hypothetical protein [Segatella buccae]
MDGIEPPWRHYSPTIESREASNKGGARLLHHSRLAVARLVQGLCTDGATAMHRPETFLSNERPG